MVNKIEHLQSSLQGELKNLRKISPKRCIYNVPHHLQMANEGAYTPLVVSIGPLHHNDGHLLRNEIHKLNYLESFLGRSQQINRGLKRLKDYLELVEEKENDIREYYADPKVAEVDSGELIKMVLVDAAFLIELFGRGSNNWFIEDDDQMFSNPRMVVEVSQDIRLAENQLPFFILEELYNAAGFDKPNGQGNPSSFLSSACKFLNIRTPSAGQYKHLLDLVRTDFLPSIRREQREKINGTEKSIDVCKTATALREAGVKFTVNKDSAPPCGWLDIKFNTSWCRGTLSIPKLVVYDDTEALFKNLAVFEQCHYFDDSYIIDYITFMDFLVNTEEDVELLVNHGIIEHWLGSNSKVADMFNGLSKHLRLRSGNFYYATLCTQLNDYYNRPCNHHLAVLRQKYFNHPWATISVVYAILLLILTVLQAATGVIQILPKKS